MLISFKVLSTHLLNADALIIVLDFFQISLKNCRVLIILSLFNFQGSFAPFQALYAHPFSKVPDYITTTKPVCQHFFSIFFNFFKTFFRSDFCHKILGFVLLLHHNFIRKSRRNLPAFKIYPKKLNAPIDCKNNNIISVGAIYLIITV